MEKVIMNLTENNDGKTAVEIERMTRIKIVEDALLKTATGYFKEEVQLEEIIDPVSGEPQNNIKRKTSRTEVPGNLRAQIFWLINCVDGKWKEHPEKFIQSADGDTLDNMDFNEHELQM
jgi:hypothetical protein